MDKQQQNPKSVNKLCLKSLLRFVIAILVVWLLCWILSGICFGFLSIFIKTQKLRINFECDWWQYLYNPFYIFSMYENWWNILIKSLRHINPNKVLFIPFIAVTGTLAAIFAVIAKHEYTMRLWFVLNFHFAKIKDIKKMEIMQNMGTVLGRFSGILLTAKDNHSVLCVGEMGSGKTSSVSIPSVLQADNASILAVDLTGMLPQYTAGYRSKIGETVYFNWDMSDEPDNNIFYPRWNPLEAPYLPSQPEEREKYLRRIASYFIDIKTDKTENYWNLTVYELIVTMLDYWVCKTAQAQANDYFLEKINSNEPLSKDEKDILLSYYIQMPKKLVKNAIDALNNDKISIEEYIPIGSWGGVPEQWQGKNLCFAMIADWMIFNYENSSDKNSEDWSKWLKSLFDESRIFAYGQHIINGFDKILQLSAQQRALILSQTIKPFEIFSEDSLRERTNGNDIDFSRLRGIYDENENRLKPMTVYSLANTANSKIINRMFIDEILQYLMDNYNENTAALPFMFVLDDVGHNLRLNNLTTVLEKGKDKQISSLLLCNSLSLVANTYSREDLETMIIYTDYKIVKASDNRHMSQQMDKLASFATRSVEIPKYHFKSKGKCWNDANYFHKLAKDFKLYNDVQINTKEYQVVVARGFCNYPIIADNIFFAQDKKFAKMSSYPANYTLSLQKVLQKPESALFTPKANYNESDIKEKASSDHE